MYNQNTRYKNIQSLTSATLTTCDRCQVWVEQEDSQVTIPCEHCMEWNDEELPKFMSETDAVVTRYSCKRYRYDYGVSMNLKVEDKDLQVEVVFEKSPLYTVVKSLNNNSPHV